MGGGSRGWGRVLMGARESAKDSRLMLVNTAAKFRFHGSYGGPDGGFTEELRQTASSCAMGGGVVEIKNWPPGEGGFGDGGHCWASQQWHRARGVRRPGRRRKGHLLATSLPRRMPALETSLPTAFQHVELQDGDLGVALDEKSRKSGKTYCSARKGRVFENETRKQSSSRLTTPCSTAKMR